MSISRLATFVFLSLGVVATGCSDTESGFVASLINRTSGGTASGLGVRLTVPPGAASEDVPAGFESQPNPAGANPSYTAAGAGVRISVPVTLSFSAPITLEVPYDPALIPAGQTPDDLVVLIQDAQGNLFVAAPVSVDPVNQRVSVQVTMLGTVGAAAPSGPLLSVSWTQATSSVSETASSQQIDAQLSTLGGVGIAFDLTSQVPVSGTASRGVDFQPLASSSLTFPSGSTDASTQSVTVVPLDDGTIELDETVVLLLGVPAPAGGVGAIATHTLTLLSDETAQLVFRDAASSTAGETGSLNIAVDLVIAGTSTLPADVNFDVAVSGGTAVGADYQLSGATGLSFAAGSANGTSLTVNLAPQGDALVEGSETVELTIQNVSGPGSVGTQGTHTTTIGDSDAAQVAFTQAASSSVDEGTDLAVSLTLSATPGATLARAVTVEAIDAGGGTATSTTDYQAFGTQSVTFPVGSADGATQSVTVMPIQDTDPEGNETVNLGLQNLSGPAALGGQTTHQATVRDDEALIAFQAPTTSLGTEGAAPMIAVELTIPGGGTLTGDVMIDVVDLGSGSAASGSDYTALGTQTLTFLMGATTGTVMNVTLTGQDDSLVEGAETIDLALQNLVGPAALGIQATHQATITDDEAPATVAFQAPTSMAAEPGGPLPVQVTLGAVGNLGQPVTVEVLDALTGSAAAAFDYTALGTQTVTFPVGSMPGAMQAVNLGILQDTGVELPETVNLTLQNPGGPAGLGAQTTHQVTIADDETATVAFQTATSTTPGEGSAFTVTAVLTTTPAGATLAVPVTADVTDAMSGTATSGTDYPVFGTQVLTFAVGAGNGALQNASFTPATDLLVEGPETLDLALGNVAAPGALGMQAAHTVTITDSDAATLAFQAATSSTADEATPLAVQVLLRTTPPGATLAAGVSADVTDAGGGTALGGGTDYTAFGTQTANFMGGAMDGATQAVTLTPTAMDLLVEGPETVNLQLGNPGGSVSLGAQLAHQVTILDDDAASVAFALANSATMDEGTALSVDVQLTTVPAGATLAVAVTADAVDAGTGSATAGDLTAFGTQGVTFMTGAGNAALQSVTLTPTQDTIIEGTETVDLALQNVGGPATLGGQTAHAVSITDDETAVLSFQAAMSASVDEATPLSVAVQLVTTPPGATLGNPATVEVVDAGMGTALSGTDYTAIGTQMLTFATGLMDGALQNATLTPTQDTLVEGAETVNLALQNAAGSAALGMGLAHQATITDDETPATLDFTLAMNSAGEAAGAAGVSVTLGAVGTLGQPVTVDVVDALSGTATDGGTDYPTLMTQTLTFPAGTLPGATMSAMVTPVDDLLVEGPETIDFTLQNPTGPAALGMGTAHVLTITDSDTATVAFAAANSATLDEGTALMVQATLTTVPAGATLAAAAMVDVVDAGGGTATDGGTDYATFGTQTLTFAAMSGNGAMQAATLAPGGADNLVEGPETVNLALQNPSGAATLGTQIAHEVTITDDETATVAFAAAMSASADESTPLGVSVTLTTLPATATLAAGVSVEVVDAGGGSAISGTDYTAVGMQMLSFPAASGNGTALMATLTPTDDTVIEGDEIVNLGLQNLSGAATLGMQLSHTATITDDETATVGFQLAASATPDEAAAPLSVAVTLTTTPPGATLGNPAMVDVVDAGGGSATSGTDYTAVGTQTLMFAAGAMDGAAQNAALIPVQDLLLEGNETVNLALQNATGSAALGMALAHQVTITEDETGTVEFQAANSTSADELSAHLVPVTLVLTPAGATLDTAVMVDVVDAGGGSALSGTDYMAIGMQTLTFGVGSPSGAVENAMLTPLADMLVEGSETVNLGLQTPVGPISLGAVLGHAAAITDDDAATVSFQTANSATTDEGTALTVNVLLSTTPPGGTVVPAVTADAVDAGGGTATTPPAAGADYAAFGVQGVVFAAMSADGAVQTVTFTPTQDTVIEGGETANLGLQNVGAPATLGMQSTHAVTITDDETGVLQFQAAMSATADEATPLSVAVQLVTTPPGATLGNPATVEVIDAGGGTAVAADFTAIGTQVLMFPVGTMDGGVQNATVAPTQDMLVEGPETVNLGLQNAAGAAGLGMAVAHQVTIGDDEAPATLDFQLAAGTTAENAGAGLTVTVTLTATGNLGQPVMVDVVDLLTGAATPGMGNDYATFGPMDTQTLTFAPGSMPGATQDATLTPQDDLLVEGPETVNLALQNPTGPAGLGAGTAHQVTLTDDDTATLAFAGAMSASVDEATPLDVQVVLLTSPAGATLAANLTVDAVDAGGGTAIGAGTDYAAFGTQTATFMAGAGNNAMQPVTLTPTANDLLVEGPETVNLLLQNPVGAGTLGMQTMHQATITDGDAATVAFAAAMGATMDEGTALSVVVTLTTVPAGANLAVGVTAEAVDAGMGSATSATDYTAFGTQPVAFAVGQGNGATQNVTLTPLQDTVIEGNETVNLGLQNLVGPATFGMPSTTQVAITDDETATVTFQAAMSATADEATPLMVAVQLVTTPPGATLGNAATVEVVDGGGGLAMSTVDYQLFGTQMLSFMVGSMDGAVQNATFNPIQEMLVEGPEGTTLNLQNAAGAATLGMQTSHAVTITDDEPAATVDFQAMMSAAAENAAPLGVTVVLGAVGPLGQPVTVDVRDLLTGTAAAGMGNDYATFGPMNIQTLTFAAGSTPGATQDATLTQQDDPNAELNETVNLTLENVGGPAGLGMGTTHTATIQDDETPQAAYALATSATMNESAALTVTVTLAGLPLGGVLDAALTVDAVDAGMGTALSGTDYTAFGVQSLSFPVGSANGAVQTATLTPTVDLLVEGPETVNLGLAMPAGPALAGLGMQATHQVTITDQDTATVAFSTGASTAADEMTPHAGVVVTLTTVPAGATLATAVTAQVADAGTGSATPGMDYVAGFPQMPMFPAGAGNGTMVPVSVAPTDDTLVEGPETLDLTLGMISAPAMAGMTLAHTVTITDDEAAATVSLQAATGLIAENAGMNLDVNVVLGAVGNLGQPVTVDLRDLGTGTATAGMGNDYATFGPMGIQTVTFAAGSMPGAVQAATLVLQDDALVEGAETVDLMLENAGGPAGISGGTGFTATITDDEPGATVAFVTAAGMVNENVGMHPITVVLTSAGTLGQPVTVDVVDAMSGTATPGMGNDYTTFGTQTLTFAAGSMSGATQDATLDVLDDMGFEMTETVDLALQNPGGPGALGMLVAHTVAILDDDQPPPTAPTGLSLRPSLTWAPGPTVSVTAFWDDDATTETGYDLERSPAGMMTFAAVATGGANLETLTDTTAVPGTAYDYRAVAVNGGGRSPGAALTLVTPGVPTINAVAGTPGTPGYGGDGPAPAAGNAMNLPAGLGVEPDGALWVGDAGNARLRRLDVVANELTTFAGTGTPGFAGDGGAATVATVQDMFDVAVDGGGNPIFVDAARGSLRRITTYLTTPTIDRIFSDGTGVLGPYPGDGLHGLEDGVIRAGQPPMLAGPFAMALDPAGNAFLATINGGGSILRVDVATGVVTTVVGDAVAGMAGFNGDGPGATRQLNLAGTTGVVVSADGRTLFFADVVNGLVRSVDLSDPTTYTVTTVAGDLAGAPNPGFAGDNGPALGAQVDPNRLALDGDGNLFIGSGTNNTIRRVDAATGVITTVIGPGLGTMGDGGPASMAQLNGPLDVVIDRYDTLYFSDNGNHSVRRIHNLTQLQITTRSVPFVMEGVDYAAEVRARGGSGGYTWTIINGALPAGLLEGTSPNNPNDFRITGESSTVGTHHITLQVMDSEMHTAEVELDVTVATPIAQTLLGQNADGTPEVPAAMPPDTDHPGTTGDGPPGPATMALCNHPVGLEIAPDGDLVYVDEFNHRVRRIDSVTKVMSDVAGIGPPVGFFGGDGGPATMAVINGAHNTHIDALGGIYIADTENQVVRYINPFTGIITTVAGTPTMAGLANDGGFADDTGVTLASTPHDVAIDRAGGIYWISTDNNRVRRTEPLTGIIRTYAGDPLAVHPVPGGFGGDMGPAVAPGVQFNIPVGIAFDTDDHLYIADAVNVSVRRVDRATQILTTHIGSGPGGFGCFATDQPPAAAQAFTLDNVFIDLAGNIYYTPLSCQRVRRLDPSANLVRDFIGNGFDEFNPMGGGHSGDGGPASSAQISTPFDAVQGHDGTFYFSNRFGNRIRTVGRPHLGLVINEVDYAQPGADTAEFVELYNGTNYPIDLTGIQILLMRDVGTIYRTIDLTPQGTLPPFEFLTVHDAAVTPVGGVSVTPIPGGSIQDGPGDAIVLFDSVNELVIDAFVYEPHPRGSLRAALGASMRDYQLVEGRPATAQDDGTMAGMSVGRTNGQDTNDAQTDWSVQVATPGAPN